MNREEFPEFGKNFRKRRTATGFERFHNLETRDQALAEFGQWVIDTCLTFGCQPELAWQVAATFTRGLRKELENET